MERRLPVAPALVHAGRIFADHAREQIEAIELRRGARVRHRACGEQTLGRTTGGGVQGVKAACPPVAAAVGVGAELEEQLDHREVVGVGDDRRRVEPEHRLVDVLAELRMLLEEMSYRTCVAPVESASQLFDSACVRRHVALVLEAILVYRDSQSGRPACQVQRKDIDPHRRKEKTTACVTAEDAEGAEVFTLPLSATSAVKK